MSNPLSIHLFNCDRTYKLDAVEDWLNEAKQAKPKLEVQFAIKQHYFSLSEMSELSSKKIPSLQMDMAVFVVHAHESRLSINEDNAGIGYAKIYRALLDATGDNVVIVIGGDDNYKNKDEENKEFISRWAKRKLSSQFSEEFLDGRKSFIFSWNKKHREIHEKALVHFLDTSKKGQKFEYQPKPKLSSKPATQLQTRATEPARRKPENTRTQPRPGTSDPLHDIRTEEKITGVRYESSSCGTVTEEIVSPYSKPGQPSWAAEPTRNKGEEPSPPQRPGTWDPPPYDDRFKGKKTEDSHPSASQSKLTGGNAPLYTKSTDRSGQLEFERKKQKDLSVLGWSAKNESLSAVTQLIRKHRVILDLASEPDLLNTTVHEMISYLKENPLKYCVLVVDAEKVKSAQHDFQREDADYVTLLQTAERNVEKKILVVVCCPPSMSTDDEKDVNQTIEKAFRDNRKVFVAWFKNGKLALQEDDFISLLTAAIAGTRTYPQTQDHSTPYHQFSPFGTGATYAQGNVASGSSQQFCNQSSFASDSQRTFQPQDITENPLSHRPTNSYDYKIVLPPGKTVMLMTHLHKGIISYQKEDVKYWKPGFVVPDNMVSDLQHKYSKTTDTELFILMNEADKLIYQTDKKKEKGWQNSMRLALDETLMLTTRLRKGQFSYEGKDVVVRYLNWRVPEDVVANLTQFFPGITAELFVFSDSQEKLRCIVQDGADRFSCRFVPFIDDRSGKTRYGGKAWEHSKLSKKSR